MQLFPPALDKEWCAHFQTFRQDYGIADSKRRAIDACLYTRAMKLHDMLQELERPKSHANDVNKVGDKWTLYGQPARDIAVLNAEIHLLQIARMGIGQ